MNGVDVARISVRITIAAADVVGVVGVATEDVLGECGGSRWSYGGKEERLEGR